MGCFQIGIRDQMHDCRLTFTNDTDGSVGGGGTPISNGYGCKVYTSKGWGIR